MDKIKKSFQKVKEDIFFLGEKISKLEESISKINSFLEIINKEITELKLNILENNSKIKNKNNNLFIPTQKEKIQTNNSDIKTNKEDSADKIYFKGLKKENYNVSIGNNGVPTDRQTDRQTNEQTKNIEENNKKINKIDNKNNISEISVVPNYYKEKYKNLNVVDKNKENITIKNDFEEILKILNSLDIIKKEIRNKFKRLTEQEFKVFSYIYDLEEKGFLVDYKLLSEKLNLTESSVRDYVGKLIKKGIPIIKEKINNKQVILHISKELKEVTPLETIIKLRNI
ncbi:MAG: hypothetical protein QW117_01260 [Candidatus Pacearchaeota archaeon]